MDSRREALDKIERLMDFGAPQHLDKVHYSPFRWACGHTKLLGRGEIRELIHLEERWWRSWDFLKEQFSFDDHKRLCKDESDFDSNPPKRPDSDSIQTSSLRLETAILADCRQDFAM